MQNLVSTMTAELNLHEILANQGSIHEHNWSKRMNTEES